MSKLLLVDDDRTTTDLLKILLEMDGFTVTVVLRGSEAVAMAEKVRPDLILMDYHLPDLYGVEVLKHIRRHPTLHAVPVVIGSGMNVGPEVMAAGATRFLIKPYEPAALAPLFQSLIG